MGRKKALTWREVRDEDRYVDHYSTDGHWYAAEGYDEHARKRRRPVLLMHRTAPNKGPWKRVDTFASMREAKNFAEELA